ncbi:MAG: transcriptional regulator NrdR, partial [Nitrospirales bacterium]
TYERVEEILPRVVKKDGRRESFDRTKILAGLKKACEKRPISTATIETVTDRIEKRIQELGDTEIESRIVGEELMKELHQLDQVAYVRFASVYREFKDIDQFMDELRTLAQQRRER